MIKRIFTTSFYSVVARFFSTGTSLFIIFFISRFLNEQALGLYGIAFFFFQLFAVISYQGLDVFFSKETAAKRDDAEDLAKLGSEFLSSILYGVIISLILFLVFHLFYHKIGFMLLFLSLLTGILYALERNLGGFLLGKERVAVDAFYMFISFITMAALLLVFRNNISLEKIFLLRIVSFAIGVIGRWAAVAKSIPLKKITWKLRYFGETRFYWFLVICVFAERHIDIFILSFFIAEAQLGGYFLSLSIYRTICLLIEVLSQAFTPFISRIFQGKEKIGFRRFVNYLFAGSLASGILLGLLLFSARDFIVMVFNKNLVASCSSFLMILSFAVPLKVVIFMLGAVMSSTAYQKVRFYINLYTSILFVLLLPVLVHFFAAPGAIFGRVGFEILVFLASIYFIFVALKHPLNLEPGSLRIGFDAKWFFSGNPSGRVVVRNLLSCLLTQNEGDEFYIFLKKEDKDKVFPYRKPGVHFVYVWGKNNLLANLFVVPIKAFFLRLDVFIFQYFAPLVGNFKKITFINDIIFKSNPEYFSLKERIYFSPMKFLARRSHRVCTISHAEKKRLVQYKFAKAGAIDVIHLGVGKEFKPRQYHEQSLLDEVIAKYRLPDKFLLYVGRLNERKNLAGLIKALALLADDSIKLVIAGAGDREMKDLSRLIGELKLTDRVIFTGFVEDEHLASLYALAEIFCYVSYDEGFGLPPLEAMASGVPVVSSPTGSLPEICGPAGNYADPGKPGEIAAAIDLLLKDRVLYEEKKKLGLQRARSFAWEESAKMLTASCWKTVG